MTASRLIKILQMTGYKPRSYSGRGMMGRRCIAFCVDRDESIFALGAKLAVTDSEISRLFVKMDNLGIGYVIYFPHIDWPSDLNESEDEDEDPQLDE